MDLVGSVLPDENRFHTLRRAPSAPASRPEPEEKLLTLWSIAFEFQVTVRDLVSDLW